MKLDHVAIQVTDLDASIAFYSGRLGMPLMFRELDADHREAFAYMRLDGGNIELLQRLDADLKPVPMPARRVEEPYCPHIAIKTANLDEVIALMERAGVNILKGPLMIPGKVRWLYVADPDGNILEFVEWL